MNGAAPSLLSVAVLVLPTWVRAQEAGEGAAKGAQSRIERLDAGPDQFLEPMNGFLLERSRSRWEAEVSRRLVGEGRPQCAMVAAPSWKPEWSVQMRQTSTGAIEVITRRFTNDGLESITQGIERASEELDGDRLTSLTRLKRIERVSRPPEEHRARLDAATAERVIEVCTAVLLLTRYPEAGPRRGFDGTTHYFVHQGHRGPPSLSARVWSPRRNTLAALFIHMEESLAAFAESDEASRATAEKKLVEAVRHVSDRLSNL